MTWRNELRFGVIIIAGLVIVACPFVLLVALLVALL
jgi:hypothetical protein